MNLCCEVWPAIILDTLLVPLCFFLSLFRFTSGIFIDISIVILLFHIQTAVNMNRTYQNIELRISTHLFLLTIYTRFFFIRRCINNCVGFHILIHTPKPENFTHIRLNSCTQTVDIYEVKLSSEGEWD